MRDLTVPSVSSLPLSVMACSHIHRRGVIDSERPIVSTIDNLCVNFRFSTCEILAIFCVHVCEKFDTRVLQCSPASVQIANLLG